MAKTSMINKEGKRSKLVKRYAETRKKLREQVIDQTLSDEARRDAMFKLQKLPRDSSASRVRRRCQLTGRPHGFYRKFGLGRNKLRQATMNGDVPGVVKASW
jgi:small subunit ribosomal protein S14